VDRRLASPLAPELRLVLAVWCTLASLQTLWPGPAGVRASFCASLALVELWPRAVDARGRSTGRRNLPRPVELARAAAFGALGFVLHPGLGALAVQLLVVAGGLPGPVRVPGSGSIHPPPDAGPGADLVSALLLAPLFEERLYRGRLLRALAPRLGSALAVAICALCFALPHFDALRVLGSALAGLVLGAVATWTGRTLPCIALHAGLNRAGIARGVGPCGGVP
jgi:membrane protease YdiL (CAAX protease family)